MRKFIALALILICCACEKSGPDQGDYTFHDRYFTSAKVQHNLERAAGEYFVLIKEKEAAGVIARLETEGFTVTTEPYKWIYYTSEEYNADQLAKCVAFTVQGYEKALYVPNAVYTNHLYKNEAGDVVGKTNTFLIKFTKNQRDAQLVKVKEYAKEHKFLILGDASSEYFRLACTDETSGNCVEMANWFVEVAGFKAAEPEFPEMTIDSDNQ